MNHHAIVAALAASLGVACAPAALPPPAEPEATMPDIPLPEVAGDSGLARVVISADVPARVDRIADGVTHRGLRSFTETIHTLLCAATPCAVTLPYGDYQVEMTAVDEPNRVTEVVVHVNASTVVVNQVLPREVHSHARSGAIAALALGIPILVAGLVLAADGSGDRATAAESAIASQQVTLGIVASAVGGGLVTLGGALFAITPGEDQQGATRQWTPPPSSAGLSMGARF